MQRRSLWILLFAALVMVLTMGCSLATLGKKAPAPTPTFTKTPKPTFTATPIIIDTPTPIPSNTPTLTNTPEPTATDTPQPTATFTETPVPTDTPTPKPQGIINLDNLNFRAGPDTTYASLGKLIKGTQMEVRMRLPDSSWLRVCCLNDQEGWVASQYMDLSVPLESIPVDTSVPPTPTPRPQPPTNTPRPAAPTQPPQPTATSAPAYPFALLKGVEKCEPNAGTTYFNGFVRYKNNNLRNGVCVHVAFYGPRSTKCSGCDGAGDGVWGFSPFGGPAAAGTTVEIYVVTCPASMPEGGQSDNFSDLTPRSEKWVYTVKESVQCTGITFYGD
jgi:hypothetical protein